jgi:hypothetical protein
MADFDNLNHDFSLEPPDELIAELQSSVVQSRLRGERSRGQLIADIAASVRVMLATGDTRQAIPTAAALLRLREEWPTA